MKRWAWNIFCALSLLILATSVTLWVRSYSAPDWVEWSSTRWDNSYRPEGIRTVAHGFAYKRGSVAIFRSWSYYWDIPAGPTGLVHHDLIVAPSLVVLPSRDDHVNLWLGDFQLLSWGQARSHIWMAHKRLVLPLWLFLIFALPPFIWWRKRRAGGGRGFTVQISPAAGVARPAMASAPPAAEPKP